MSGTIDHVSVDLKIDALLAKALDLDTPIDPLLYTLSLRLTNGTATGNASQMWHDQRTLIASATEDLDLAGSLTNAFGVTLTFVKVKFVFVKASSANTNDVQVQRIATTGIPLFMADGDGIALGPGEFFCYGSPTTGKTVTATTDDTLTFTNSAGGTSVTYDVIIIGTD
jgi:hypothetical protein